MKRIKRHTQTFKFKPKVKQRPRLGRKGRVFTPPQTLEFEKAIRDGYKGPQMSGPVSVTITLYPDKFTVTITECGNLEKTALRGDIDNYAKAILDGLNRVAFEDDRQVRELRVTKR